MYEIGQFLDNQFEVGRNAVTVEIMAIWIDPDDQETYYLVKCRAVADDHGHMMYSSWYYEDEVDLVSEAHLYKYFEIVEA
jgi:hypothetical protein